MKKFSILPFLFILFLTPSLAQQSREAIQKKAEDYFSAMEKRDWNAAVDMLYARLFEVVSKEQLIEVFNSMESEGMKMAMKDFNIRNISDITTHEGEKYALVEYSMTMSLEFTSVEYRDSTVQAMVNANFEKIYGSGNVKWQKENYRFDIMTTLAMFAIANEGSDDWYFIENDKDKQELANLFIPEPVRAALLKND